MHIGLKFAPETTLRLSFTRKQNICPNNLWTSMYCITTKVEICPCDFYALKEFFQKNYRNFDENCGDYTNIRILGLSGEGRRLTFPLQYPPKKHTFLKICDLTIPN